MRKLDVSSITDSAEFPLKQGTLQFLQDAFADIASAIIEALINPNVSPGYDPSLVYVLSGIVNSGAGSVYNYSGGYLYYNGEIFLMDATSFTLGGGQVAVVTISTTQYTTNADPVTFTDLTVHNIHNIRKMTIFSALSGSGISDAFNMKPVGLLIAPPLNLTTPTSGAFAGNIAQVSGVFPDISLFVPAPSFHNIVKIGNQGVGNVGVDGNVLDGGVCSWYAVAFGVNVGTTAYNIAGALVAASGVDESNAACSWVVRSKTATGFVLIVKKKDSGSGTTNLSFDYSIII